MYVHAVMFPLKQCRFIAVCWFLAEQLNASPNISLIAAHILQVLDNVSRQAVHNLQKIHIPPVRIFYFIPFFAGGLARSFVVGS
jgi:hypothetical protein